MTPWSDLIHRLKDFHKLSYSLRNLVVKWVIMYLIIIMDAMKFHIFATAQLSTVQPHQNIFKVRLPVKMASKSREIQTDFWKTHPYLLFAGYYTKTSVSNEIPMEEFSKNRFSSWPEKSKFWKKMEEFSKKINYLRKLVLKSLS